MTQSALDFTFKIKADFLAVLGHPARLRLIEALKRRGKSVGALAAETQLSQPATSKHLAALRLAGILEARPSGKTVYYHIADPAIFNVLLRVNAMLLAQMKRSEQALRSLGRKP